MEQNKAIALTSSNQPTILNVQMIAGFRLDKTIPHYKDIAKPRRITWLKEQIISLNMIRHQMTEDWQVEFDATALDEFIMDDFYASDLTLPEIKDAFKRGLMGDYGDYYGLTAESLYGFIRGWFMSDKKRKATEIVRNTLKGRDPHQGEFYLEKVRAYAEQMKKNSKI